MGNAVLNVGEKRERSGKKKRLPKVVIAIRLWREKQSALSTTFGCLFSPEKKFDQKIYLRPSCICHLDGRSGLATKVLVNEGSKV
jgi:hypothetical protein